MDTHNNGKAFAQFIYIVAFIYIGIVLCDNGTSSTDTSDIAASKRETSMVLQIGLTSSYIHKHGFTHLIDIPEKSALEWIDSLGLKSSGILDDDGEWVNKFWVVVGCEHDRWVAIYRSDYNYSLYIKSYEETDE